LMLLLGMYEHEPAGAGAPSPTDASLLAPA
jgi:hypothetical protein